MVDSFLCATPEQRCNYVLSLAAFSFLLSQLRIAVQQYWGELSKSHWTPTYLSA